MAATLTQRGESDRSRRRKNNRPRRGPRVSSARSSRRPGGGGAGSRGSTQEQSQSWCLSKPYLAGIAARMPSGGCGERRGGTSALPGETATMRAWAPWLEGGTGARPVRATASPAAGCRGWARRLQRNPAMLAAVLFDLDGTLVDTNDMHVRAWHAALREHGFHVAPDRIAVEVGKGGDQLVPDLLGRGAEREAGEALRRAHGEAFTRLAGRDGIRTMPGATA